MEKKCAGCNQVKDFSEFGRDKGRKDGLNVYCRICVNAISKKWSQDNPDKRRASVNKWNQSHVEQNRIKVKNWYRQHPEKSNQWIKKHPEERIEITHRHRAKYPEKYKARSTVNNAILTGKLPCANTLTCTQCGNQASEYHHHNGYDSDHWLDVIPLCKACHKD